MKLPWSTSFWMKTLQDPCQKNLCISIFFCQPTFSCKSHLLEQLLTVLADPLLLVVTRDVVPHRLILPKSSGKCKAALLRAQNCVRFYELSQPLFSIVWLPHPLVPRGRVVLTSLASSATETICPPGV